MPRSIKRRLELLERRPPPGPADGKPGWLLSELERRVRDGHPWTALPSFRSAWAADLAARERVLADPTVPPAGYNPGWREADRQRVWLTWDEPRVADAVDRVLLVVADDWELLRRQGHTPVVGDDGDGTE